MTRLGDEIGGLALDLTWSLWSELGVDGTVRRHDWQAIDLEPLLMFTSWIGSADRRLRSRTIEWSIGNHRLTSAIRMRNLGRRSSPSTRESFGRYAATVRAHTSAPWPAGGDPLGIVPSASVDAPDLRRPSLLQLRLRALVGVSARAEVLRVLLSDHDRPKPAAALAEAAAYSKGSVAQALELLTLAGIVQMQPSGNRLVYRLARPAELRQTLQSLPAGFPDWPPIFRITESLATYARSAPSSSSVRTSKMQTLLQTIDDDVRRLGIADAVPKVSGPASVAEVERWAVTFVADQAGMTQVSSAAREVAYKVQHLVPGGWIGTMHDRGREPRHLGPSSELEEQSGAAAVSLAMFHDVLGRENQKLMGKASANGGVAAISRAFADQIVAVIERGQEVTFTAEFLRRWFENRRGRTEG
jgi:hypothetical protein